MFRELFTFMVLSDEEYKYIWENKKDDEILEHNLMVIKLLSKFNEYEMLVHKNEVGDLLLNPNDGLSSYINKQKALYELTSTIQRRNTSVPLSETQRRKSGNSYRGIWRQLPITHTWHCNDYEHRRNKKVRNKSVAKRKLETKNKRNIRDPYQKYIELYTKKN